MRDHIIAAGVTALALPLALPAAPAAAQTSTVSYVSRTGNDAGACAAFEPPCRTVLYALGRTVSGGTIHCLDSGTFAFGSFTINRSVIIDCISVSAASVGTITIDDSATGSPGSINVVLRGLRLNGRASGQSTGIRFVSGYSLTLDGVDVQNFTSGPAPITGVHFAPTRAARLHVANSIIANNGVPGSGAGILIAPTGAGYASATLDNVQLIGNTFGLFVSGTPEAASSTNVLINRSVISGGSYGVDVTATAQPGASATITNSTISGAANAGLFAVGGLAQIRVGTSTISGNSNGLERVAGGLIASYGDNRLTGNGVNGTFNGVLTDN